MTPLSRIMHQVAKVIINWNFFWIRTIILSTEILLHFQWSRRLRSCTMLLKQYSTGTFYIHILRVIKTTNNAFSITPLSRIMHQVAKTILHRNFCYIYTKIIIKIIYNAFSMTPLSRIMHQVAKTILHRNFCYIYT